MTNEQRAAALRLADAMESAAGCKLDLDCAYLLRAIAAEPVAEPVAWAWDHDENEGTPVRWLSESKAAIHADATNIRPLYTAPPQREPLTDEEIKLILATELGGIAARIPPGWRRIVQAIERAHGIGGQHE